MEQGIDTSDVLRRCRAHGFEATEVRFDDGVLELVPADLDALPSTDLLRALAEELRDGEVRYVTLVVGETS